MLTKEIRAPGRERRDQAQESYKMRKRSLPSPTIESWKGAKYVTPRKMPVGTWVTLSWKQSRPSRLKTSFLPPLNCLKEFRKEAYTRKSAITRDNFFTGETYLRGRANIFLPNICSSCELSSSPFKPQTLIPFLSLGWHINLNCLTASESPIFIRLRYVQNSIFLYVQN